MLPSRRETSWDSGAAKTSGSGSGSTSKRRRFLNRLIRLSSSPTLKRSEQQSSSSPPSSSSSARVTTTPGSRPTGKRAVSCITLPSGFASDDGNCDTAAAAAAAASAGGGAAQAPYSTASTTQSSFELFVDCEDGLDSTELETGWESLPEELKVKILGWLEPRDLVRHSVVSKEFRRLCYDGQLWRTIDASEFYDRIPVEPLASLIATAGPFVRHLNLRGCIQLQQDWRVDGVANACRHLLSISLEGCRFERSIVGYMVSRNPRLVHVNFSGLQAVSNSTCRMLAESCRHIESLDVSFCCNADGRGLRKIVERCRYLKELRACELNMNDPGLMQALFKTNHVQSLHLGNANGLTDDFIRVLVEGVDPVIDPLTDRSSAPARELVQLGLGNCVHLTDDTLRHLSGRIPHVRKLDLAGNPSFTDAGFAELLLSIPDLVHLDIEECSELTNATLTNISRSPAAKRLIHLAVSYCENMGDNGMVHVLRKCERLANLEMDNTRVSDVTLAEAISAVKRRPAHCPVVASNPASHVALRMVVFDCSNVTWTGIREILTRNVEHMRDGAWQPGLILLKCFYEYQRVVDEHTALVLRRDTDTASRLEHAWARHMMAREEAGAHGRRRRARALAGWGGDDGGIRRRVSRGICSIM